MCNCPKCNWPMTIRSSRPAANEKEKEKECYMRCEKCGYAETITVPK